MLHCMDTGGRHAQLARFQHEVWCCWLKQVAGCGCCNTTIEPTPHPPSKKWYLHGGIPKRPRGHERLMLHALLRE